MFWICNYILALIVLSLSNFVHVFFGLHLILFTCYRCNPCCSFISEFIYVNSVQCMTFVLFYYIVLQLSKYLKNKITSFNINFCKAQFKLYYDKCYLFTCNDKTLPIYITTLTKCYDNQIQNLLSTNTI